MGFNVAKLYEAVDSGNLDAFAALLEDDIVFQFGNAPELYGVSAVIEALEAFYRSIRGVRHFLHKVFSVDGHTFLTCDVEYFRLDGTSLRIPAAVLLRHGEERISEYRIFVDNGEL
ncbi:SnoaL-like domain protein [compost metagenome]